MRKDIVLVALIVASLALMVVPISPGLIDTLLAVNMTLGVTLLMVAVYLKHPSDFSTFPSVILLGTAFRLALSIGTTRLILTEAEAGDIIGTFGDFVVGGSIAVGLVIFLIITVVQFIVVTKGAERVAEVGARFALDALPGKQMSIDAEARAGNLTAEEAAEKRQRLDRDSRFFGAMDGAMKFVKGDAIAGLIIICINLLGGIAVGVSAHGYSFSEAVGIFSLLTVGDGLVAQLPALLMSLCAGIVVTRAEGQGGKDLGSDISAEIIADPRVPAVGAPIVLGIGLIPGFPTLTFAAMAVGLLIVSAMVRRAVKAAAAEEAARQMEQAELDQAQADNDDLPQSDRIRLKIAKNLADQLDLAAVDAELGGHLQMLYHVRGVCFGKPLIETCTQLEANTIIIDIDDVPVHRQVMPDNALLIIGGDRAVLARLSGAEDTVKWPLIEGTWLSDDKRNDLATHELVPQTAETGIACLAFRIYEQNLGALFSFAVFSNLLEDARAAEPQLMEKIAEELNEGALHKMFRYLIEDGVPLKPFALLVASIHYWLTTLDEHSPVILAECLRESMKRQLCHRIASDDGMLGVALLGPRLEGDIRRAIARSGDSNRDQASETLALTPEIDDRLITAVRRIDTRQRSNARQVALVAPADLRRRLRNHLATNGIQLPVLAPHEIAKEIPTVPLDLVEAPKQSTAFKPRGKTMAMTN